MSTAPRSPRTSKYNNRRTWYRGERYDSWGEAAYARHLDARQAAGEIYAWRRGRLWVLLEEPDGVTLTPDFEVWVTPEQREFHDFKGVVTEVFRIKARVFRERYPGVPLYVVKADGQEVRV
jgi:hypothetical protein